jgi:signal transduction histidine kinase
MRIFFYTFLTVITHSYDLKAQNAIHIPYGFNSKMSIGSQVWLLEDPFGHLKIEDVVGVKLESEFIAYNKPILTFGNSTSYFWLKIELQNDANKELMLKIDQPIIEELDFYDFKNRWIGWHSGYSVPIRSRLFKTRYPAFKLAKGNATYYIRLKANALAVPLDVLTVEAWELQNMVDDFVMGVVTGILLITAIYYLFIGIVLKSIEFIYYVVLVLIYAVAGLSQQGYLLYFYNARYFEWQNFISSIVIAVLIFYSYTFLKLGRTKSLLKKIYVCFIVLFLLQAVLSAFANDGRILFMLWQICFFFIIPLNIFSGFYLGKKRKSVVNNYFAFAYVIFFVLLILELAHLNVGFKYYFIAPYVFLGYVTEVSVLGYALSKKFELLHSDLQKAKEEALAENLRLVETQNQQLERKVEERTLELMEKSSMLKRQNFQIQQSQEEIISQKENIETQNILLSVQNEKLKILNEEQTNLMSIVSHDLKTPIGHINGFASILKHELRELNSEQLGFLNMIIDATKRLSSMITNILHFGAFEALNCKVTMEIIDVNTLIADIVKSFELQAEDKMIKIHIVQNFVHPLNVYADRGYLYQVLENLISNAIKFSPYEKNIYVSAFQAGDCVRATVRDEGPGIADDDRAKLFGKFQRLTAQPIGNEKSTGLGLSIAKKFMELMNGKIWCESKAGQGAIFIVELLLPPSILQTEVHSSA